MLTGGALRPYYAVVAAAFKERVEADGGTVESMSCLKQDLKVLNPIKPPAFTGLLNEYSGAAAAYSLRLLDNTYSGDAIVVTTNGSDSASIGFVNNELDTASLEAFAGSGDAYVSVWYDQSGNGNNATQTSFSSMPKIVSSGSTILENGKAAVEFDGTSVFFQASSVNVPQPTSYFITYRYNNFSSDLYNDLSDGNVSRQLNDNTGGGYVRAFAGSTFLSSILSSNNQELRYSLFNGLNSALAINGGLAQTGNAGALAINNMNIGKSGASYMDGKIQEFIIYPTNQSSNRTGIETNINSYYSIY